MADGVVPAVQKQCRVLTLFTTVVTDCGYRNVASLYLHLAHVIFFLFASALVRDGYTDVRQGQIQCLSRALRVHRVTGS